MECGAAGVIVKNMSKISMLLFTTVHCMHFIKRSYDTCHMLSPNVSALHIWS